MSSPQVYDFVAVGLGPFNLGLACLTDPIDELDGVFLEADEQFSWHPGMLLPEASLQVPFLADLVTMADPSSPYSFLSYLKEQGRLYSFYIRESFYPLRREYDAYCRWAADRLPSVRFGQEVVGVEHDGRHYLVTTAAGDRYTARRLVLGTGTQPHLPDALAGIVGDGPAIHSAQYLARKSDLQRQDRIAVIGSGQSAAEVYADLLAEMDDHGYALTWVTRSPRFFPLEYTKLTLEMTSPEYSAYFQQLPAETRRTLLEEHKHLYKGISGDTINAIFDELYARQFAGRTETTLLTASEVVGARRDGGTFVLDLHHREQEEDFRIAADALVCATGYRAGVPEFLAPIRERIVWEGDRYAVSSDFAIDRGGDEIYVQNAEEHTHGFVAPDLGMGAYRNSVIIAAMLGREVYPVEKRIAFQEFGVPDRFRHDDQRQQQRHEQEISA